MGGSVCERAGEGVRGCEGVWEDVKGWECG